MVGSGVNEVVGEGTSDGEGRAAAVSWVASGMDVVAMTAGGSVGTAATVAVAVAASVGGAGDEVEIRGAAVLFTVGEGEAWAQPTREAAARNNARSR
jgi:hypothetical protein